MSPQTISIFCRQLADIINAQIVIYEGLEMLMSDWEEEALNGEMVTILNEVVNYLKLGKPLDDALDRTKKFPAYMVHMITIGIRTNKLQGVLEQLADHYERAYSIQTSIRNCIYYPMMLMNMSLIVLIILILKVLPLFESYLCRYKVTESNLFLFNLGKHMMTDTLGVLFIIFIVMMNGFIMRKLKFTKKLLDYTKFSQRMATAELASAFSLMLASQLSVEEAFQLCKALIENQEVKKRVSHTSDLLEQGKRLNEALSESKLFSKLEVKKIEMALKLECLEETVGNIARSYEENVHQSLEKMVSYIEKGSIFIVSILIADILVSIFLPLISVLSTLE